MPVVSPSPSLCLPGFSYCFHTLGVPRSSFTTCSSFRVFYISLLLLFFPFTSFLEMNGETFNVMGGWRSVARFVKQHTNSIEKVILFHTSLLYKLKVMGGL